MPEGPEIRLAADTIADAIESKKIEEIEAGLPHLQNAVIALRGEKVREVETRGKAMLIHFANNQTIYSHNQLYGVWKVVKRGSLPQTKRSLRLALHTDKKSALLYSASDIGVYQSHELEAHPFLSKIGPDILNKQLTWQSVAERLVHKRFRNRKLSILYLDQHFLAGIGNYLRSEILFAAGLHPDLKPSDLNQEQVNILAQQTLSISLRSYHTKGFTVPDNLGRVLSKSDNNYESARFMVFNREQETCRICVSPIVRATRNGRRIYWCNNCQKS